MSLREKRVGVHSMFLLLPLMEIEAWDEERRVEEAWGGGRKKLDN